MMIQLNIDNIVQDIKNHAKQIFSKDFLEYYEKKIKIKYKKYRDIIYQCYIDFIKREAELKIEQILKAKKRF